MTTTFKSTAFAAALIALGALFGAAPVAAKTLDAQPIGRPVAAPAGFLDFCRRQPSECRTAGQDAQDDGHIQREAASLYWSANFDGDGAAAIRSWRAQAARQAATQAELDFQAVSESIGDDAFGNTIDAGVATDGASAVQPVITPPSAQRLTLTPARWSQINHINDRTNARLQYVSDQAQYARADYWAEVPANAGAPARGDCEDYVLTKRRDLIAAGVAADALSVAIVQTPQGESHSVLILAGQDGDYVLDNINPRIVRWDQTGYRWKSRQAPGAIFDWVQVADAS